MNLRFSMKWVISSHYADEAAGWGLIRGKMVIFIIDGSSFNDT